MRRLRLIVLACLLSALAAVLATGPAQAMTADRPVASAAAEPPNQNDPCSRAGRNTCRTTGVGQYRNYRYGVRWFGDYRGAVPGVSAPTFCIDLRFWYPGRQFDYEERSAGGLKNRDGDAVSETNLHRMAYALWRFGRTESKNRQGAMMLYVHSLMGDAEPGEVAKNAIGPAVEREYDRIARDSARFAGPYSIDASGPGKLEAGDRGTLRVRVRSASGAVVPNVKLALDGSGLEGLAATASTGSSGTASLPFTAASARDNIEIDVRASDLPSDLPTVYAPTSGQSARNGQRLVAGKSQTVRERVEVGVEQSVLKVTTKATPAVLLHGESNQDEVTITGAPPAWRAKVEVRVFGPARTQQSISCTGTPLATLSYDARPGKTRAPRITPPGPGWYGYQLVIPSTPDVQGVTTPCPVPEETFKVETQPRVRTQISHQVADPGTNITDTVFVEGLAGEKVTVQARLYGPYPAADKMTCQGAPAWTGEFDAQADGSYVTEPYEVNTPGYYTYVEGIAASDFVRKTDTACGEPSETVIVRGRPRIQTQISAQESAPGAQISDTVLVTGLGVHPAPVQVELWGPFPTLADMKCEGTPFATQTFTANGDGSYVTEPLTLGGAGYYTYREAILPTAAYEGVQTACGEAAETTLAKAAPVVETVVSDQVVKPGGKIFDTLRVSGLGPSTAARVDVELFGPFTARSQISCSGTPYWKGTVDVAGDGEYKTPEVVLKDAGFYTYRESIAPSPLMKEARTACAEEAETALAAPLILTGRGEGEDAKPAGVRPAGGTARAAQAVPDDDDGPSGPSGVSGPSGATGATGPTGTAPPPKSGTPSAPDVDARQPVSPKPTQVSYRRLNISANVFAATIDRSQQALGVPKDIQRVGWWRDGAAPDSEQGTTLLAGHVDSATRGAGAFYRLRGARRGDRITVTAGGSTETYRVTSLRRMRKGDLPTSVFSRSGPRRLVLVTCGGQFDQRSGHYRDNIVVTAVPAG